MNSLKDLERRLRKVPCCKCFREMTEHQSKNLNLIELPYKAKWEYPIAGNILDGTFGRAMAIVCDRCLHDRKPIEYAVRFIDPDSKQFELIAISELEPIAELEF